MSEGEKKTLWVKFDIAHITIQRLNYPALCQLEKLNMVWRLVQPTIIRMLARHSVTSLQSQRDNSSLKN